MAKIRRLYSIARDTKDQALQAQIRTIRDSETNRHKAAVGKLLR